MKSFQDNKSYYALQACRMRAYKETTFVPKTNRKCVMPCRQATEPAPRHWPLGQAAANDPVAKFLANCR